MQIQNMIRAFGHIMARSLSFATYRNPRPPVQRPKQLDLGLNQTTEPGLALRDAIPIRSAEYWLKLGEPNLALKELETLSESASQHAWPLRVRLNAIHAANN